MSDVSVIMSVYQEKDEHLRRAVDSVLSQTRQDLELLIYLDGEQPKTRETLEEIAETDPRVHILGEKENQGLGHGLNVCIERAAGKYLARMDSDDISEPQRLERQIRFLEEQPEWDFVGCNTLLFDDEGVYGSREMKSDPGREDFYEYLPFIHPSVVFRSRVFADGTRYPETKDSLRCEDLALFMELYASGKRGANLPEYLYRYREDLNAYAKKKYRYRLTESRVRRKGYRRLQLKGAKTWLYTVKPLAVGLIPPPLMLALKKQRDFRGMRHETTYEHI